MFPAHAATPTRPRSCSPQTQWAPRRDEYCQLVGKPADGTAALAAAEVELHAALADLDAQLAAGDPAGVRLNADGELIIPPLAAEDIPAEADALRDELAGILPVVPIASLLVEVDARTGFTGHLTHAGGKATRARSSNATCSTSSRRGHQHGPGRDGRLGRRLL